jgi:hypothetical protein
MPRNNGMAVASLVCSLAGLVSCGVLAILGIIFGFVARNQIERSRGTETGKGLATAGIVIGSVLVALGILYIVFWVIILGFSVTGSSS